MMLYRNANTIEQVQVNISNQFPLATEKEIQKISWKLMGPIKYQYRSAIFLIGSY